MEHRHDCHDHNHGSEQHSVWAKCMVLNGAYGLSELILVSWQLGSVALLTDAMHNLSDGLSLGVPWLAVTLAARAHSGRWTNGYKRTQDLAALFNFITLVAIMIWAIHEAYGRFDNPREFSGMGVMIIGVAGIGVNFLSMRLLHGGEHHHHDNLAKQSAYWHQASDFASAVVVVVAGAIIWLTGWSTVDPLLTIIMAVALIIISLTKGGGVETCFRLSGATPRNIDMNAVKQTLDRLCGEGAVHNITVHADGARVKLFMHVLSTAEAERQKEMRQAIRKAMCGFGFVDVDPTFEHPSEECEHAGHPYGAPVLRGEDLYALAGHSH